MLPIIHNWIAYRRQNCRLSGKIGNVDNDDDNNNNNMPLFTRAMGKTHMEPVYVGCTLCKLFNSDGKEREREIEREKNK